MATDEKPVVLLATRVTVEQAAKFQAIAKREDRSGAAVLRRLIEARLAAEERAAA